MINMDEYYHKIVDKKTEDKIRSRIKVDTYMSVYYAVFIIIAAFFMIYGMIQIYKKQGAILYFIGLGIMLINVATLLFIESRDPLKAYNVNDKAFIYMWFLKNEITNIGQKEKKRFFYLLKLHFIIIKINRQLHMIENNIKNIFIFQSLDYKVRVDLIKDIVNILNEKAKYLVKKNKENELILLIDAVITVYEYTIFNELNNDEECRKSIIKRKVKIDDLGNIVDQLGKMEMEDSENSKLDFIMKSSKNPYILSCIIAISGIVLFAFKETFSYIFNFVVYFCGIITAIGFVFQMNQKNDKGN